MRERCLGACKTIPHKFGRSREFCASLPAQRGQIVTQINALTDAGDRLNTQVGGFYRQTSASLAISRKRVSCGLLSTVRLQSWPLGMMPMKVHCVEQLKLLSLIQVFLEHIVP